MQNERVKQQDDLYGNIFNRGHTKTDTRACEEYFLIKQYMSKAFYNNFCRYIHDFHQTYWENCTLRVALLEWAYEVKIKKIEDTNTWPSPDMIVIDDPI